MKIEMISEKFKELFNARPYVVRSPGRVNLIGEHTDYNNGFVLPAAVNRSIMMAINPREDDICHIHAFDLDKQVEVNLKHIKPSKDQWPNYILGVIDQLLQRNYKIKGFNCVYGGDIPIAAGLSSSAALEGAICFALNQIFALKLDKIEMVKIGQAAEHEFVGVKCGIMDQFINIFGEINSVMQLDCRSLEYKHYPFETDKIKIVLCDTQIKRELASSEYNLRREQCEHGVKILKDFDDNLHSLRDVSLNFLDNHRQSLDPLIYKRCAYVIQENFRVINCCSDLENNDLKAFGRRMYESHSGLKNDYEVSCDELDLLVDLASEITGVLGARMMGGGFGGCTINLVENQFVKNFTKQIQAEYAKRINSDIKIHICNIEKGTEEVLL
jgi:galactokinase